MQPVAERLAGLLPEGALRLSSPVGRIAQDDRGVVVDAGGTPVGAERAVVALPPTLAGRIDYEPPLPAQRDQLVQHMPQGSVIKFHVLYDTPWWRAEGLSGTVLCPGEPIGVTFDCTPPAGTPGLITGFEGPAAVAAGRRTTEERRDTVVDVLARTLGERPRRPRLRRPGLVGRALHPRVLRRPPATGAWTVYGPALRAPVGRIHWAGTETAERWTATSTAPSTAGSGWPPRCSTRSATDHVRHRLRATAGRHAVRQAERPARRRGPGPALVRPASPER